MSDDKLTKEIALKLVKIASGLCDDYGDVADWVVWADEAKDIIKAVRTAAIEECAQNVEKFGVRDYDASDVAFRLRELKEPK